MDEFSINLKQIRARARDQMKQGAVTKANTANVPALVAVLNQALATEIVCVLRYKNHYHMAKGIRGQLVAEEFLEHANEEQQHADMLATRISELGGEPDMNPATLLERSHTEYKSSGGELLQMMTEDLVAERIAIETYTEIIRWIGDHDPTTRRMIEEILAKEEEHADDLAQLINQL